MVAAMTTATDSPTSTDSGTAVTRARLAAVLADLADLVGAVTGPDRGAPTPCTGFDVAALLDHVIGWLDTFADGYADPGGRAPRSDVAGLHAPTDPAEAAAAVRAAAARLDAALADGAADRPLFLGEASMPGELALNMILWEYQVHGWDLATALDRGWHPDPAGLEASIAFAPMMLSDDYQGEGKIFAPRVPVPEVAPALDRLLGLSGRDPHPRLPRFGYLGWMRTAPGRRDEIVAILTRATDALPGAGCLRYAVALDDDDADVVRISEIWRTRAHHEASLDLPATREAIAEAMPLLTGEMGGHRTTVVGGLC